MNRFSLSHRILLPATFALLLGSFAGCSTTTLFKPQASVAEAPVTSDQFYSMVVKTDWGQVRKVKEPLPRPIPLQEALEKANAVPRFGSIEVVIQRVVPESGKTLRMEAEFDAEKDQIVSHQNYDIRPNDHIIVKPASSSPLDGVAGPLANIIGG